MEEGKIDMLHDVIKYCVRKLCDIHSDGIAGIMNVMTGMLHEIYDEIETDIRNEKCDKHPGLKFFDSRPTILCPEHIPDDLRNKTEDELQELLKLSTYDDVIETYSDPDVSTTVIDENMTEQARRHNVAFRILTIRDKQYFIERAKEIIQGQHLSIYLMNTRAHTIALQKIAHMCLAATYHREYEDEMNSIYKRLHKHK